MMGGFKSVRVTKLGTVETSKLEVVSSEAVAPKKGEVAINVHYAGVAFADVMMRLGMYPGVPKPPALVPGYDVVGTVEEVGEGVDEFAVGDSVIALTVYGGYSQRINFPACAPAPPENGAAKPWGGRGRIAKMPAGLGPDPETLALCLNYITAYQMMFRCARLKRGSGQTILVHGAAGGVGTAVLDLAKEAGLKVIGTASKGKHDLVRGMGGEPVDYATEDFEKRVMELTDNQGVDAALDPIGGANFSRSWRCLKRGGALVAYGATIMHPREHSGLGIVASIASFAYHLGSIKLAALFSKCTFDFYVITDYCDAHEGAFREDMALLLGLLAQKKIAPEVNQVLPLDQAADALALLDEKKSTGKVVLDCK